MKKSTDAGYLIVGSYLVIVSILIMICSPERKEVQKSFSFAASFFTIMKQPSQVDNTVIFMGEDLSPVKFMPLGKSTLLVSHVATGVKPSNSGLALEILKSDPACDCLVAPYFDPDTVAVFYADHRSSDMPNAANDYSKRYILLEDLLR